MRKKKEQKIIHLNEEQLAAVNAGSGAYCCLAGPGSGKTSVLVARYVRLLNDGGDILWGPEDILSLTFTSEAAKELRTRSGFVKQTGSRPNGFLTFHSLALSFATIERENFPFKLAPFPLATEGQSYKFIKEATRRYALDFRIFKSWMSNKKHSNISPKQARELADDQDEIAMSEAYQDYETRCQNSGVLDFDSLIMEMINLLKLNPEILKRWQYQWIQTDESQDADAMQWELIRLLSWSHKNVLSVGDANQCIFAWRSAHPELFINFKEMFPDAKFLYLGTNYRSTGEIVDFCKTVAPIKNELIEKFRSVNEQGIPPIIMPYGNDFMEAQGVVTLSKKATEGEGKSTAILARTNRQLRIYEEQCAVQNLKYYLLGKSGFWQQPEVKNIMAYARLIENPRNDTSLVAAIRAPYDPSRFIRKKELIDFLGADDTKSYYDTLRSYQHPDSQQHRSIGGFLSFVNSIQGYKNRTAKEAINNLVADLNAINYYEHEEESQADNSPKENISELIRISERFPKLSDLLDHVRKVSAISRGKKGVAIGTIHAAKGKEFDDVFVTGVSEGLLPHKNGELPEEERLFFVACSRPRDVLYLTYSGTPSRFIPTKEKTE